MERQSVLTVNCPRCGHPTDGRIGFDTIDCTECGTTVGAWDNDAGYYRLTTTAGPPMLVDEDPDDG